MSGQLLDTDIAVELLRGRNVQVSQRLAATRREQVFISTVTIAERNWPQDLQELTNLESVHYVYDNEILTALEFLSRVKKTARKKNVAYRWVPSHGKGSHGTLYYGDRLTTVQDLNAELPKGTLHVMLKQIGLTLSDIYSN